MAQRAGAPVAGSCSTRGFRPSTGLVSRHLGASHRPDDPRFDPGSLGGHPGVLRSASAYFDDRRQCERVDISKVHATRPDGRWCAGRHRNVFHALSGGSFRCYRYSWDRPTSVHRTSKAASIIPQGITPRIAADIEDMVERLASAALTAFRTSSLSTRRRPHRITCAILYIAPSHRFTRLHAMANSEDPAGDSRHVPGVPLDGGHAGLRNQVRAVLPLSALSTRVGCRLDSVASTEVLAFFSPTRRAIPVGGNGSARK
jgi:hypothetical protein